MAGPIRPQFVLFGSSIVQFSYSHQGWGAVLADLYARKVFFLNLYMLLVFWGSFIFHFYCTVLVDFHIRLCVLFHEVCEVVGCGHQLFYGSEVHSIGLRIGLFFLLLS